MTANELKIGNNVYFNKPHKEIGVVSGMVEHITGEVRIYLNHKLDTTYRLEDLAPIPLDKETLLKLEFICVEEGVYDYCDYVTLVLEDNDSDEISFDVFLRGNYIVNVWEVHQLQNLMLEMDRKIIRL